MNSSGTAAPDSRSFSTAVLGHWHRGAGPSGGRWGSWKKRPESVPCDVSCVRSSIQPFSTRIHTTWIPSTHQDITLSINPTHIPQQQLIQFNTSSHHNNILSTHQPHNTRYHINTRNHNNTRDQTTITIRNIPQQPYKQSP